MNITPIRRSHPRLLEKTVQCFVIFVRFGFFERTNHCLVMPSCVEADAIRPPMPVFVAAQRSPTQIEYVKELIPILFDDFPPIVCGFDDHFTTQCKRPASKYPGNE